ncbi:MAG: tRNA (adenosine(37)-N6)-dimethylallyltransferase MiaA [Treponema sp.]|nr:tRNA (adenosine(37)-N6)-dimethylallyltransferase MiaA [Treponema sp.]
MDFDSVLVLVGPTASGKTDLLASLFGKGAAFEGRAEVISADSMQAYRGMDIGTAKPGSDLLDSLPHHLLDMRDPDEQFTVGDFVSLAEVAIIDIISRGRLPIVAGGTGYYIRSLILGLPDAPPSDPAIRAAVAADLARLGPSALRAELASGDPASASRIHPNDLYRLTRALEILRATGRPLSDFLPAAVHQAGSVSGGVSGGASGGEAGCVEGAASVHPSRRPARSWHFVHYRRPREELASRIASRVDRMLAAGLADEVDSLVAKGYGTKAPGMRAIGYAEFLELRGAGLAGQALLEAARARIVVDSIKYAKRQETFFRGIARALRHNGAFEDGALENSVFEGGALENGTSQDGARQNGARETGAREGEAREIADDGAAAKGPGGRTATGQILTLTTIDATDFSADVARLAAVASDAFAGAAGVRVAAARAGAGVARAADAGAAVARLTAARPPDA